VWVEKVKIATKRAVGLETLRNRDDAIGKLLTAIDDLRAKPDELAASYAPQFERLRAKLPSAALRAGIDPYEPSVLLRAIDDAEARLANLLTEGGLG
jgi:hypothetical protein